MTRSILCMTALVLLGTASVQAGEIGNKPQIAVPYGDININEPAGARVLLMRLEAASSQVCGRAHNNRDLGARAVYRNCANDAQARAIASLPFNLMAKLDKSIGAELVAQR